jgi:hypothetical protein
VPHLLRGEARQVREALRRLDEAARIGDRQLARVVVEHRHLVVGLLACGVVGREGR